MKASDIAYMAALVEKSPSSYPRRKELLEELQTIYRNAQSRPMGWRVPVQPTIGVMEVERG